MRDYVTIVRCKLNKYRTPLFSYDRKGVYIRCKDCREMRDGDWKRGVYHLIPWSVIMRIIVGTWDSEKEVDFGTIASNPEVDSGSYEKPSSDNSSGGRGDQGGQLDGASDGLSDLSSVATADSA